MIKYISFFTIILLITTNNFGFGQTTNGSTLTFYYIDNCQSNSKGPLDRSLIDVLLEKINKQSTNPNNLFFLFASNGSDFKIIGNLSDAYSYLENYVKKPSKMAFYLKDKAEIRDYFVNNNVHVSTSVVFNLFLSSCAIENVINNTLDLPLPVVLPKELLVYLNANPNQLNTIINIYTNNDVFDSLGEENLKSTLNFCSQKLNTPNINYNFIASE